ncbi:MAG: YegP family protein [Candidatus Eisenbacteria bacterium]|nr:YegP family protein [Candidatus Eisenbacteria bacterium]
MTPRYVMKRATDGSYFWNLIAGNGETILTSERYAAKGTALNGIDSAKANSPYDVRYDRRTSSRGEPYFVLKGSNGEVIGNSEMYSSTTAREGGINAVKVAGPIGGLDDRTASPLGVR